MSNLSHYIIEDVQNLYSHISETSQTETDEINEVAGDIYATVAYSMLHEGYSASGILGFLSTAPDEEILERYYNFDENLIAESTISEEYINEQVEQLDEFVGAALRILGAAAKGAKYAKGVKGFAPLARGGAALKAAGTATTRVAKQGPGASSVVRSGLSKIKGAASKALPGLKNAAKTLIPGAAGFALGRATAPKGEKPKETKAPEVSTPAPSGPAAPSAPSKPVVKQTGDKKKDMETWAKANPKLAAANAETKRTRGTAQTTNPLMKDFRDKMPAGSPTVQAPEVKGLGKGYQALTNNPYAGKSAENKKPTEKSVEKDTEVKKEAYDVVLDYLLSEGHAETVEEAHYIMLRLDAEHVQEIVSEGYQRNPEKGEMPDRSREAIPGQAPRGMPPRGNADREAFEKWYRLQQASKKTKSSVKKA